MRALQSLKICTLIGVLMSEVHKVLAKKSQRSDVSSQWAVMQNLKNLLLVAKMIWGIWQIFMQALKSLESGTLTGSLCPKFINLWPKNYRGVMCNNTEEWYGI